MSPDEQTKLRLEIRKLQQETDGWSWFRAWLPGSAALVALTAAIWGIWTYLADARRDRRLRLEDKIEENIGILVEFPSDSSAGIGKVHNSLRNLHALVLVARAHDRTRIERRVSEAVAEIVSYDLELTDVRQARLDALALDGWEAYRQLLREDAALRGGIVSRYVVALRSLRNTDPSKYENARQLAGIYHFGKGIDDTALQLFATLVASYHSHVGLVSDADERKQAIHNFAAALANQRLTNDVFGGTATDAGVQA
jgi:hypothetical protein